MNYQVERDSTTSIQNAYRILLFDDQHQFIGYARGEFRQYSTWYSGQLHFFLSELVVSDQIHRQQGAGSALLIVVESFARRQGAHWIRGQFDGKRLESFYAPLDQPNLNGFWMKHGYAFKQEVYDDSIRFGKPLLRFDQQENYASTNAA